MLPALSHANFVLIDVSRGASKSPKGGTEEERERGREIEKVVKPDKF